MSKSTLLTFSDLVTMAHARIQQDFRYLDPVISVNHKMRAIGIPADAVTIDCMKSGKRILVVLHDEQPNIINYQFGFQNQDPDKLFKSVSMDQITSQALYNWMRNYF